MHVARQAGGRDADRPVGHEHPAQPGWHFVDWGCEFLGTMALVLGGISAVVLDFGTRSPVASTVPSHSLRLLLTGLLFAGCGSLVAISPIGRRSGAHLNPSITIAFFCQRHLRVGDAVGYITAQCLGAIAGAGALRLLWGARAVSVHDGRTLPGPGVSTPEAVGIEALMTVVLVLVVFAFVSSTANRSLDPASGLDRGRSPRLAWSALYRHEPQRSPQSRAGCHKWELD